MHISETPNNTVIKAMADFHRWDKNFKMETLEKIGPPVIPALVAVAKNPHEHYFLRKQRD